MDYNKLKLEAIYELTHNRSEISDEFKAEYIKLISSPACVKIDVNYNLMCNNCEGCMFCIYCDNCFDCSFSSRLKNCVICSESQDLALCSYCNHCKTCINCCRCNLCDNCNLADNLNEISFNTNSKKRVKKSIIVD